MLKNFIPNLHISSIYKLDLEYLKKLNIKLILLDLDNTLISYNDKLPNEELIAFKDKLISEGFELILVSNSKKSRVEYFCDEFGIKYIKFAKKPMKKGFKQALEIASKKYDISEVCEIGDQVMTDVLGANRMKFTSILVDPIDRKSELFITKLNRVYESFFKFLVKIFKNKMYKKHFIEYIGEVND